MSVLTAIKSTPLTPSAIMRLIALLPAPPTPITRMLAALSVFVVCCILFSLPSIVSKENCYVDQAKGLKQGGFVPRSSVVSTGELLQH